MSALTLYQVAAEYQQSLEQLLELDIDDQTFKDTLEGLSGELEAKSVNVALFIRNVEATAVAIKDAEAKMKARREALEKRAARLIDYLKHNMEICGISKIESPQISLKIRKNPPSLVVDCEAQIPKYYWIEPPPPAPVLDKKGIKEALSSGVEVEGVHLESGTRLEIK
jgi:hypothetical protein